MFQKDGICTLCRHPHDGGVHDCVKNLEAALATVKTADEMHVEHGRALHALGVVMEELRRLRLASGVETHEDVDPVYGYPSAHLLKGLEGKICAHALGNQLLGLCHPYNCNQNVNDAESYSLGWDQGRRRGILEAIEEVHALIYQSKAQPV